MLKKLFGLKKEKKNFELDLENIPRHVAIIMDGNGRWAKKRGLPRNAGHRQGVQALKKICTAAGDLGIHYLSIFAFSTENWDRPKNEVSFLMNLFKKTFRDEMDELVEKGVRVKILGRKMGVESEILAEMMELERRTSTNTGFQLNICFNYGSRAEIVDAVKKIVAEAEQPEKIDEKYFQQFLYTKGLPDVELVIRTSGEMRLSNFLLYQSAYAELVFTPVYWPDFTKSDLITAIWEFQNRNRRFGRL